MTKSKEKPLTPEEQQELDETWVKLGMDEWFDELMEEGIRKAMEDEGSAKGLRQGLDEPQSPSLPTFHEAGDKMKEGPVSIYIKDTERGVRVSPRFRRIKPFFNAWLDFMIQYEKRIENDWPFWYGERPLVGFLTAAIWKSRGVCIEEYQANKKASVAERSQRSSGRRKGEPYLGRGDLYFSYGDAEGNVEFKMRDLGISEVDHFSSFLRTKWRKTAADARNFSERGIDRFGGMFLRPYIGKKRDADRYHANLKDLLKTIWDTRRPDALAWWCPIEKVIENDRNTENLVVGVILVIKGVS